MQSTIGVGCVNDFVLCCSYCGGDGRFLSIFRIGQLDNFGIECGVICDKIFNDFEAIIVAMIVAEDNFPCHRRLDFGQAIEQGLDSKGLVSKRDEGCHSSDFGI